MIKHLRTRPKKYNYNITEIPEIKTDYYKTPASSRVFNLRFDLMKLLRKEHKPSVHRKASLDALRMKSDTMTILA